MSSKERLIELLVKSGYLKTPRIVEAFRAIDRADFVLPVSRGETYRNYPLSIGHNQTISQPLTVAFMLECLNPQPGEGVLDIGSGSGWTTALLAHLVGVRGRVIGLERIPEVCAFGRKNLTKYFRESRAAIRCVDGFPGFADGAPYDKILAGAAADADVPDAWRKQLKVGGRIVAPVNDSVWVFVKKSETRWEEKEYPGFAFVPLVGDKSQKMKDKSVMVAEPSKYKKIVVASVFGLLALGVLMNEIYIPLKRTSVTVEIPVGAGSRQIAEILKKEGIIRSKWLFVSYVTLRGDASRLKPGRYTWSTVSLHSVARSIAAGGAEEHTITIPEGWSVQDIAALLERENILKQQFFIDAVASSSPDWNIKFSFLADRPLRAGLEGYLFPDTYRIFSNSKPEAVIEKLLVNFDKKLTTEMREEIARQGKTIFEIITMASLIEKEVVEEEDRALVSGVLWRRLDAGIPLQVDATIIYITGKRSTKVSREETQIDSPYNTYKYAGLPVGPIANPGLSAIRAAMYPKKSPHLYYLSTPEGETIFSRTLEEHNEAKARYLK